MTDSSKGKMCTISDDELYQLTKIVGTWARTMSKNTSDIDKLLSDWLTDHTEKPLKGRCMVS